MIGEHDLTRLQHPHELVEGRLGLRHEGDDELRRDGVEALIRKAEVGDIHHLQALHMGEPFLLDLVLGPAEHVLRQIDPMDLGVPGIVAEGQPVPTPASSTLGPQATAAFTAARAAGSVSLS